MASHSEAAFLLPKAIAQSPIPTAYKYSSASHFLYSNSNLKKSAKFRKSSIVKRFLVIAMATAGYYIAEAHVMRKLHREKMKRIEEERAMAGAGAGAVTGDSPAKKSSGCFQIFKKVHPSNGQAVVNSVKEDEEAGKLESRGL